MYGGDVSKKNQPIGAMCAVVVFSQIYGCVVEKRAADSECIRGALVARKLAAAGATVAAKAAKPFSTETMSGVRDRQPFFNAENY